MIGHDFWYQILLNVCQVPNEKSINPSNHMMRITNVINKLKTMKQKKAQATEKWGNIFKRKREEYPR